MDDGWQYTVNGTFRHIDGLHVLMFIKGKEGDTWVWSNENDGDVQVLYTWKTKEDKDWDFNKQTDNLKDAMHRAMNG